MHNLDHSILHKIVRTAKKSILDPQHVVDITSAIFVGLSQTLVRSSKGTTLQHHSSENKNVPAHRTVYHFDKSRSLHILSHTFRESKCTKGGCRRQRKVHK